jgi:hypothetical protein
MTARSPAPMPRASRARSRLMGRVDIGEID